MCRNPFSHTFPIYFFNVANCKYTCLLPGGVIEGRINGPIIDDVPQIEHPDVIEHIHERHEQVEECIFESIFEEMRPMAEMTCLSLK